MHQLIIAVINLCYWHYYVNSLFIIIVYNTYNYFIILFYMYHIYHSCVDFHQHPVDTTVCQGDDAMFTCVVFIPSGAIISKATWVRDMQDVNNTMRYIITDNQTDETTPVYIENTLTVTNVMARADNGSIYKCCAFLECSNNSTLRVESKCILMSCFFDVHIV